MTDVTGSLLGGEMMITVGKEWWKHGEDENHNYGNPSGEE